MRAHRSNIELLQTERVPVDDDLAIEWAIAPIVALWSAGSKGSRIWIISGDLPTDYVADPSIGSAREAMRAFVKRWNDVSAHLLKGQQHPTVTIGSGSAKKELTALGDILKRRAEVLHDWVENKAKWAQGLS